MIRLDSVTKVYRGVPRPALDAVSLEIGSGEFVFLVGASGSGKSSLLRLMLREEKPSNGEIHVLGQRLTSISSRKVPLFRRNLGVVFQDFRLLPNKTVYDNVAFTLQVIGKSRGFIQEAVPDVLRMVGLAEKAGRLPNELSGGEQQRVAIARAVVNKPKILLADEPTGNLDPATSLEIMSVLEQINLSGTTVVMATHDVSIVDRLQKRVIELEGGHIIRDELEGAYVTTSVPVQAAPVMEPTEERRPAWARGAAGGRSSAPQFAPVVMQQPFEPVAHAAPPLVVREPTFGPSAVVPIPVAPSPVVRSTPAPMLREPAAASPAPFESAFAEALRVAEPVADSEAQQPERSDRIVTGAAASAWSYFAAPSDEDPAPAVDLGAQTDDVEYGRMPADDVAAANDAAAALRARMEAIVLRDAPHTASAPPSAVAPRPAAPSMELPVARPVFVVPPVDEPRTPPWAAPAPTAQVAAPPPATSEQPTVHPGLDDWDDEPITASRPVVETYADVDLDEDPDDEPQVSIVERPAARAWFEQARAVPLPQSALVADAADDADDQPRPYRRTFPREMLEDTAAVPMQRTPVQLSEAERAVRTFTGPIDLTGIGAPDDTAQGAGKHRVELPAHLDFVGRLGLRDDSSEPGEEVGPSS